MINLEATEKELDTIRSLRHMPTLLKVLQRNYEAKKERLVDELNNDSLRKGHAQMLRDIISLIED